MKDEYLRVFRALADPKRLRIIELLMESEECSCVLLDDLGISQPTLSHHMKILCDSGIVTGRKQGKWMYYRINEDGCDYAGQLLEKIKNHDTDGLIKILMRMNRLFRKDRKSSGQGCCCGDVSTI